MKTIPLIIVILAWLLGASTEVRADRIPVDLKTRTVTQEHILLEVSDAQAEEMDTQDTLTLTTEQWKLLRAKGLMWPMRLEWIVNYDEDTCGCALMGHTGIRLDEKRVAIVPGYSDIESTEQALAAASERVNDSKRISLRIDRKGQFYAKGILLPYREVLSYFQKATGPSGENGPPNLSIRFPVGIDRQSPAIKERLDQLEAAATKSGWEVNVERKLGAPAQEN
jgi:hypothetical protein